MGDFDGDGKDELFFSTPPGLAAYYWDAAANDFAVVVDPGSSLANVIKAGIDLAR